MKLSNSFDFSEKLGTMNPYHCFLNLTLLHQSCFLRTILKNYLGLKTAQKQRRDWTKLWRIQRYLQYKIKVQEVPNDSKWQFEREFSERETSWESILKMASPSVSRQILDCLFVLIIPQKQQERSETYGAYIWVSISRVLRFINPHMGHFNYNTE